MSIEYPAMALRLNNLGGAVGLVGGDVHDSLQGSVPHELWTYALGSM